MRYLADESRLWFEWRGLTGIFGSIGLLPVVQRLIGQWMGLQHLNRPGWDRRPGLGPDLILGVRVGIGH